MMSNRLSFSAMDISEKSRERRKPPERSTFARISRRFSSKKEISPSSGQISGKSDRSGADVTWRNVGKGRVSSQFRETKPISFSRPDLSTNQMAGYSNHVTNQQHYQQHYSAAIRLSQNNLANQPPSQSNPGGYAPVLAIRKTSTGHSRLSLLSIGQS